MQRDRHRPQSMAEDGPRERTARRRDKFSERQAELADAALETLAELGYARTSLREIAQHSAFSHGVLHYYFHDKVELILCGLRQYRARCVAPCDRIAVDDCRFDELLDGFAERLAARLRDEARLHRLWYDLRAQALFEAAFRPDVAEIERSLSETVWRVVRRLADDGMTLLMVTHEMRFARDVCDRVVFMHQGRVHESGPPAELFGNPQQPKTKEFLSRFLQK